MRGLLLVGVQLSERAASIDHLGDGVREVPHLLGGAAPDHHCLSHRGSEPERPYLGLAAVRQAVAAWRPARRARGGPSQDRLDSPAAGIEKAGGTATVVEADITDRIQAEAAVEQTVERFGRLDTLVNNAGLMLLGPVVGADAEEWERMIAVDVQGLLYTTRVALPHLLKAAEDGPRRVADISSVAGRVAMNGLGVYNLTKFGVNGFTESLSQEVTQRHVRVGVLEPGGVYTELALHNRPVIQDEMITPLLGVVEFLAPEDIANGVAYMVTRPRHASIGELLALSPRSGSGPLLVVRPRRVISE